MWLIKKGIRVFFQEGPTAFIRKTTRYFYRKLAEAEVLYRQSPSYEKGIGRHGRDLLRTRGLLYIVKKIPRFSARLLAFIILRFFLFFGGHKGQEVAAYRHLPTARKFNVLFLLGLGEKDNSNRYRVYNLQEQLKLFGLESEALCWWEAASRPRDFLTSFDLIVIFRADLNPFLEELVELFKSLNIAVVFSTDDLTFDPDPKIINRIDGFKRLPADEQEHYIKGVRGHKKALSKIGYLIATTDYLKRYGEKFGAKGFVIRNGLNRIQLEESVKALKIRGKEKGTVNIGYFSGTKTHQADFETVAPVILRLLKEYPEVNFYAGGYLALDRRFKGFGGRVKKIPFIDWRKLPYEIAKVDIQIVPLELNNPFNECKSELKYYEAALLKVPTVASATDAHRFAIKNRENGFLARNQKEWYRYLKLLIEEGGLRKKIGERAYKHALSAYTIGAQAPQTLKVFQEIINDFRAERGISLRSLSISWVIPAPVVGSGGHRNIFRAVKYLTKFGHLCRVYVLPGEGFRSSREVGDYINRNLMPLDADVILGGEKIMPCDALLATHWTTAYVVDKNRSKAAKCFYFVQDYEPYFYQMGDEYTAAEYTYKMGFTHITSGPWPVKILKEKHGVRAEYFRFPVDTKIYHPRRIKPKKRVIFLAKPDTPRRCFPLGIRALKIFKERNPGYEIVLFGSNQVEPSMVPFPYKDRGVIRDLNKLAELYASAMVGVVFSTTNPSLIPFEMMACKCPVVDLDYGDNVVNYGSKKNVTLAEPTPEKIAEAIEKLVSNEKLRKQKAENAYEFVKGFPNEKETVRRIEELILREFPK